MKANTSLMFSLRPRITPVARRLLWVALCSASLLHAASIKVDRSDGRVVLTWETADALLERSEHVTGPWSVVPDAKSPWTAPSEEATEFYRLRVDTQPRLRFAEPSLLSPEKTGGATVYVYGRNLNSGLRLFLNRQPLPGVQWIGTELIKLTLPPLSEGTYRFELTDAAGQIISQLWPGLNVVTSLPEQLLTPPNDS